MGAEIVSEGRFKITQAPVRARPAPGGETSKPIYTRAQIARLYSQHHKGAYIGREAEWARQEADFYAAQREGCAWGVTFPRLKASRLLGLRGSARAIP